MRRVVALLAFLLRELLSKLGLRYSLSLVFFIAPLSWVLENGIDSPQSEATLIFMGFSCFSFPAASYLTLQRTIQSNAAWLAALPLHRLILLGTLGGARVLSLVFGLIHSVVVLFLASLFLRGGGETHSSLQVVKAFPKFFWESRNHPWVVESSVFILSALIFLMLFGEARALKAGPRAASGGLTAEALKIGKGSLRDRLREWMKGSWGWSSSVLFFGSIVWAFQYSRVALVILFSFILVGVGIWNGLAMLSTPKKVRYRWVLIALLLCILLNASMVRVCWTAATSADLDLFSEGQEALGAFGPDLPSERWSELLQSLQGKSQIESQKLQIALRRLNGGQRLPPQVGGLRFEKFLENIRGTAGEAAGLLSLFEPSLLKGSHALALLRKMSQATAYPDLPWELLKVPMEAERISEAIRSPEPVLQDFGLLQARLRYSGVTSQGFRAEQGRSQVLAEIWALAMLNGRDERFQKRVQNTLRMILQKDPSEAIQRARVAFEIFREEKHLETPALFKAIGDEPPPVSLYVDRETGKGVKAPAASPSPTPSSLAASSPVPSPSPSAVAPPSPSPSVSPPSTPPPAPTASPNRAPLPLVSLSDLDRSGVAMGDSADAYTPPKKSKTVSQLLDEPNRRVGEKKVRVDTRAILAIPQDNRPPPRRLTRQEYLRASQERADRISQALEPMHEAVISVRWLEKPEVAKFVYEFIKTHQLVQLEAERISCQRMPFASSKTIQQDPNPSFMDACLWSLAAQRSITEDRPFAFFAHDDLFPFESHFSYLQAEDQSWVFEVFGFSLPLDRRRGF